MANAQALAAEISGQLRGWDGLTAARLSNCPNVMGALRTTDPTAGVRRLQQVVERMSRDRWQAALANALRLTGEGPETLGARRKIFATLNSVSEETVKSWEGRAIEALAAALAAEASESIWGLRLIYEVEDSGLKLLFESRVMRSSDGSFRIVNRRRESPGVLRTHLAAYVLKEEEAVEQLDVLLIFPEDQPPKEVYKIREAEDLWSLTSGAFKYSIVRAADDLSEVLLDMAPADRPYWAEAMKDAVTYSATWDSPTVGRIYGLFWTN